MATAAKFKPSPGYRPGEQVFDFRRKGYRLHVEVVTPGNPYISAALWMNGGSFTQVAFSYAELVQCHLDSKDDDDPPTLWIGGAAFNLRAAEYESLREHLVPLGLRHHVLASAAVPDRANVSADLPVPQLERSPR
jgi:hypothetical protein